MLAAIRRQLRVRDLRQADLAEALGLSENAMSRRLSGEVDFRLSEFYETALFLGVTPSALLDGLAKKSLRNPPERIDKRIDAV